MDKLVWLTFRIVLKTNVKKNGDKIESSDLVWNKSWLYIYHIPHPYTEHSEWQDGAPTMWTYKLKMRLQLGLH